MTMVGLLLYQMIARLTERTVFNRLNYWVCFKAHLRIRGQRQRRLVNNDK